MSNAERQRDEDRAAMEQMSTAGLEELLRRDFHAPEEEKTDVNRLYRAAQVLAERTPDVRADADRAWERFQKKYLLFAKVRSARYEDGGTPSSYAAPERRHSRWQRWGIGQRTQVDWVGGQGPVLPTTWIGVSGCGDRINVSFMKDAEKLFNRAYNHAIYEKGE